MDGADVSGVSARCNRYAGVLQFFQIRQRDLVSFLDPIQRLLRFRQRALDPIRQFVLWNLRHVERRNHFRIAPRFFLRRQVQLM